MGPAGSAVLRDVLVSHVGEVASSVNGAPQVLLGEVFVFERSGDSLNDGDLRLDSASLAGSDLSVVGIGLRCAE